MEDPDLPARPGDEAAPPPRRREASAIDGRLPPDVLALLAARDDLDPEKRTDVDEQAGSQPE
ncbi:hypothetical protein [Nonomuraea cavernae]|uniref:Uncharacterized protein n=1 Tax=Nonomuraea cavernae TaxID=2045107 RepID=A0A917YU67_9ACTN|nr:hypothetical protein [Nonomuraea cavernae]MCA2185549.1 hypothetical protein [Nonomuraea cavernae]GGO66805.1 hypothetical protein GCM10012289_21700 [Nonomuraea cavernae]